MFNLSNLSNSTKSTNRIYQTSSFNIFNSVNGVFNTSNTFNLPIINYPQKQWIIRGITVLISLFIIALLVCPDFAHAADSGAGLPYEDWLTKLRKSLTGPVAFAFAIFGVVVAGFTLIFGGDINGFFRSLLYLVLVISLVIGGGKYMSGLFGASATVAINSNHQYLVVKQTNHKENKLFITKQLANLNQQIMVSC